ncbi:N-acetylmuramoyl-L-alanine amidase [Actinomadura soli]|uniref:N-acetylmuramoyl-L-alanine amidase n=2 Tax=Actinomadura soli TaxID=2508997 RepID=A0A5C4JAL6_9ACTN|nr:N-acetylmuramoyl-L-alanine amidase [Actinomadura soli]
MLGSTTAVMAGALLGPIADPSLASTQVLTRAAPLIHTRPQWQARPPKVEATVLDRPPDHIVVHHTASPNSTDPSLEHAFELSRAIQTFHMDTYGWDDIGQQLTISRGGHLLEGRNRALEAINAGHHVMGAHTLSHNDHTIGIENEGTYITEEPTDELWGQLVATCAWLCRTYRLDPHAAIVGHRDYNTTACPGDALYGLLPELRNQVADTLHRPRAAAASPPAEPSGLPVPRHIFDHGPAIGPRDRTR